MRTRRDPAHTVPRDYPSQPITSQRDRPYRSCSPRLSEPTRPPRAPMRLSSPTRAAATTLAVPPQAPRRTPALHSVSSDTPRQTVPARATSRAPASRSVSTIHPRPCRLEPRDKPGHAKPTDPTAPCQRDKPTPPNPFRLERQTMPVLVQPLDTPAKPSDPPVVAQQRPTTGGLPWQHEAL